MLRKVVSFVGAFALMAATPTRVANPLQLMNFMIGTWTCSTDFNGQKQTYKARFDYVLGNSWLRETDTWSGGGDMGMLAYVPQSRKWREVITEPDGSITVFQAPDAGVAHIAYRSVYPDASMSDTYDRVSMRQFTIHFIQSANAKTTRTSDVCTKI